MLKVILLHLFILLSSVHVTYAREVQSITDKIYSNSFEEYNHFDKTRNHETQSCHADNTAYITVYSITGMAKNKIEIKLDGSTIGTLASYYPDEVPDCKTPSSKGVITIVIPAGKHTLEATSPNLNWPGHKFTVEKCSCMVIPLS